MILRKLKSLFGKDPDQIPRNSDLGQAAYWDIDPLNNLLINLSRYTPNAHDASAIGFKSGDVEVALNERLICKETVEDLREIPTDELTEGLRATVQSGVEYEYRSGLWFPVSMQKIHNEGRPPLGGAAMVDWANFPNDGPHRAFVIHHYNDHEMVVWDNVGENNVMLLLRNARNINRRTDRPNNFVGTADFIQMRNLYEQTNGEFHVKDALIVKYDGNLEWGDLGDRNKSIEFINKRAAAGGKYAFSFASEDFHLRVLELCGQKGFPVLQVDAPTNTLARIQTPASATEGMRLQTEAGNLSLAVPESSLIQLLTKRAVMRTDTGYAELCGFVDWQSRPTSSTSPGKKGQVSSSEDGSYVYLCYEDNQWCMIQAITSW